MSISATLSAANQVNAKLQGKLFLGGNYPISEDVKLFETLFGDNINVARWVKHMSSFSTKTICEWPAAAEEAKTRHIDPATEKKEEKKEEKKPEKKTAIAKTALMLDIFPLDGEVDIEAFGQTLKEVKKDGLEWADSQILPVAFGIKKLQQLVIIEDGKLDTDTVVDLIKSYEDKVSDVELVSMNNY